ncbi:hypothetical protein F4782DRAFT_522039 [Xylaria castorea]|nr:hypothetical protein F4782DRAFT_522039 [Xylaria castorea]
MIAKRLLRWKKPDLVEEVFSSKKTSQDGLVSPLNNLDGYSGLLKLASDVRTNHLKGGAMKNQRFLPNDKLEELVTKKSVLLALQETTIEQQYHEDLASWVLESGTRLFLILVLLTRGSTEQLSWLKDFKNDGINDNVLPLGFSDAEPYYGYSLAAAHTEGAQKLHPFKGWEDNNLILFETYQWMFLAPVLGASNKFRHQLSSEQPLPFLTLSQKPAKGILGETLYGEVHPAHIDSQCLSAFGVNGPGLQGIPVSIKLVQPSDNIHSFFDIDTGKFKAAHPIISPRRISPIAAYKRNGDDFVIFRWVDGDNPSN